ncbi:hypothetical protein TNCT_49551 [Trichonephila clavata]|uniref:Uncharacterized protein n=1 Tax=Trichonephila clavata TaxID=2740835 RepID=A0A8X6H322_TRICU|nr:hypothetical protein TNCT_49551 [Trichonephila clavata]
MKTIPTRFPSDNWMHVHTDDSKLDTNSNIGAGIQSEHFYLFLPLGTAKSAFDEVEAIRVTLQHLNVHPSVCESEKIAAHWGCYFF